MGTEDKNAAAGVSQVKCNIIKHRYCVKHLNDLDILFQGFLGNLNLASRQEDGTFFYS